MEGKPKNKITRLLWHERKRITAFVLAFTMTFINVVNNVSIALAAEGIQPQGHEEYDAVFLLDTDDVKEAAQSAIADGVKFDPESIAFSDLNGASEAARYDRIFKEGKDVYEIFPSVGGEVPDGAELRVFIRSAGKETLSGDEELMFLFVNASSDADMVFSVSINGVQTSGLRVPSGSFEVEEKTEKPEKPGVSGGAAGGSNGGSVVTPETPADPDKSEAGEAGDKEEVPGQEDGKTDEPADLEEEGNLPDDENTSDEENGSNEAGGSDEGNKSDDADNTEEGNAPDEGSGSNDGGNTSDEAGNPDEENTSDEAGNADDSNTSDEAGSADNGNTSDEAGNADDGNTSDEAGSADDGNTSDEAGSADDGNTSDEAGNSDEDNASDGAGEATAQISRHDVPVLTSAADMHDGELINDLEGQQGSAEQTGSEEDTYEDDNDEIITQIIGGLKGKALDSVIVDDAATARLYITTIGELPVEIETVTTPSNAEEKAELVIRYVSASDEIGEDVSIREDEVISKYAVGKEVDLDQYIVGIDGYVFAGFETDAELTGSSTILLEDYNEVTIRYMSEQAMPMTMAMVWRLGADTVDVDYNFELAAGETAPDVPDTIEVGRISETAPVVDGYTFINATVDGTPVVYVGMYEGIIYYSVDGDSAIELNEDVIVLNYKKEIQHYTVEFIYDSSKGFVTGEKSIEGGLDEVLNYSFTITPNKDCEVKTVVANGAAVSAGTDGLYTVEAVSQDLNIAVEFSEKSSFTVTKEIRASSGVSDISFSGDDSVGYGETWSGTIITPQSASLNYLLVNENYVNIPSSDTTSYTQSDGMQVSVKRTSSGGWGNPYIYTYTVTISGIKQDLNLKAYSKSTSTYEIALVQADGVEVYYWNGSELEEISAGDVVLFSYRWLGKSRAVFYAKALPGYEPKFSSSGAGFETIDSIEVYNYGGKQEAKNLGCTHEFHYTNNTDQKNRTVYLKAEPIEYEVSYDLNGGSGNINDTNDYTILDGQNIITITEKEPVKQNSIFAGWELIRSTDGYVYGANDRFEINEDTIQYAKDKEFTFRAKWLSSDTNVARYTVRHYLEQEDGSYEEAVNYTKRLTGIAGKTAFAIPQSFEGYSLNEDHPDAKATGTIKKENDLELSLYYSLGQYTINYVALTGGSISGAASQNLKYGRTTSQVTAVPDQGYRFVRWSDYKFSPSRTDKVKGNKTYQAIFEKDLSQWHSITYRSAGNPSNMPENQSDILAGETKHRSAKVPVRSGFRFDGWETRDVTVKDDGSFEMPDKDVVFTAKWSEQKYQVLYYETRGDKPFDPTVVYDEKRYASGDTAIALGSQTVHDGSGKHILVGWSTDVKWPNSGIVNKYQDYIKYLQDSRFISFGEEMTINQSNIKLYAIWASDAVIEDTKYSVTFTHAQNGGFAAGSETVFSEIPHGTLWKDAGITVPATVPNPGFEFDGWYVDGSKITAFPTEITSNLTFEARFKEGNVTIKYVAKMHGAVSQNSETIKPVSGNAAGSKAVADSGYHFTHWTDENGRVVSTDASYTPGKVNGVYVSATYTAHFEQNFNLIIRSASAEKPYDGIALTANEDKDLIVKGLLDGHTLTNISITGTITDYRVGGVKNTIAGEPVILDRDGKDVTSWYWIGIDEGRLFIAKREASIKVGSYTKTYGEADPTFEGEVTNLVSSDDLGEITFKRAEEDKNKEDAGSVIRLVADYSSPNSNYVVKVTDGQLTITKSGNNQVAATGSSQTYDGKPYGLSSYSALPGSTIWFQKEGGEWTTTPPVFTEAGSYPVLVKATHPNYEDTEAVKAVVKIARRKVTVSVDSLEKKYLEEDPEFTVTVSVPGLVKADDLGEISYKRAQGYENVEAAGSIIPIVPTYTENDNYVVIPKNGKLTIKAGTDNSVSAENLEVYYDGAEHSIIATAGKEGSTVWYLHGAEWKTEPPVYTNAGNYPITVYASNDNYEDTKPLTVTLKINKIPLEVKAEDKDKDYGEKDPELTAVVAGTVQVDGAVLGVVSGDTLNYTLNREEGEDAGEYPIYVRLGSNPNYEIEPVNGILTINKKSVGVSIKADDKSKVYGEDDPALTATISGLVGNDELDYEITRAEGNDVGDYAITITLGDNPNYDVAEPEGGTFTITPKSVSIEADDKTMTYGDPEPELTATVGETAYGETLDYELTRDPGNNAGEYIIYVNVDKDNYPNYNITTENGKLVINKKSLNVSINPKDNWKVYGDADPKLEADVTGVLEGENLNYLLIREEGENVGEYTISVELKENPNYEIETGTAVFEIKPKTITITPDPKEKTYGEKDPVLTATIGDGLLDRDAGTLKYHLTREPGEQTDTYDIRVIVEEDSNPNYIISPAYGRFTINKKQVTVKADDKSKDYGDKDPDFTATETGVINNDKLAYTLSRTSGENAGDYTITVTPGDNRNYEINPQTGILKIKPKSVGVEIIPDPKTKVYGEEDPALTAIVRGMVGNDKFDYTLEREAGNDVDVYKIRVVLGENPNYTIDVAEANFTITPKSVKVLADNKSKNYGEKDPELTAIVEGLVEGDSLEYTLKREAGEAAGTYPISVDVTPNKNYDITAAGATFTILKKATDVTITADSLSKTYGEDDPVLTATVTGLLEGDSLNYTLERETGEDVGEYKIVVHLGENPNYDIERITDGTFTITKKDAKITVDPKTKVYSDHDPALTAVVTGTVKNDELSYTLKRESGENVGNYPINAVFNADADENKNYNILVEPSTLTITPKSKDVKIIPIDSGKTYGTPQDPELKADVTGLKEGDSLNYALIRSAGEAAGTYKITVTLGSNPNYAVEVEEGTFTISPKPVEVKAVNKTKAYGSKDPEFTAETTGLVEGDHLNYHFDREDGEDVGEYPITVWVDENPNYAVKEIPGSLTITPKDADVVITPANLSKIYGDKDPDLTAEVTGLVDGDTLNYRLERVSGEDVGTYQISVVLGENKNYKPSVGTATFTIEPRPVTVTPIDNGKIYGGTDPELKASVSGLAGEDELSYQLKRAPGENAGPYDISVIFNAEDNKNYSVTGTTGVFTIAKKDATIKAENNHKVYGQQDPELTATVTGVLPKDSLVYTLLREEGEDAKNYPITVTVNEEDNPNYNITTEDAVFTILKKSTDVLIKAEYKEKTYGEADPELTAIVSGTVGDESLNYSLVREEGETAGSYKISVRLGENPNYEISTQDNIFKIKPKEITLTMDEKRKTYGEEDPELTASVTGLVGSDELNYTLSRTNGQNVGQYPIQVTVYDDPNYQVNIVGNYLYIDKKTVRIVADKKQKTYGDEDPEFTAQVFGLLEGDSISYTMTREQGEDAGSYKIMVHPETSINYEIETEDGSLVINPKTVTVKAVNNSKTYGMEDPELKALIEGLAGEDELNFTLDREQGEDAGTYVIKVTVGENKNYAVEPENGMFTINPKAATITVDSVSKTYGDADPAFTGTVSGLMKEDHLGTVQFVRAAEDKDKENVGDHIKLTAAYTANKNYDVTVVEGTLTIVSSSDNAVSATGKTVEYDGKAYGLEKAEALRTGSTLYYSVDGSNYSTEMPAFTEAGTYTVYVKASNPNYQETAAVKAEVIITKRPITITAGSASKRYDGSALTNAEAVITSGALVSGHNLEHVTVNGSQQTVGSSENIPSNAVIVAGGKDVTGNYAITYVNGQLTVTTRSSGGSSGGGGGSSSTKPGRGNGGDTGNGPGTTTINPGDVPLANLPNDITTGENILIDDGEIPLAALPKTGNPIGVHGLMAMLSGMLLAAYLTVSKKKDEDA